MGQLWLQSHSYFSANTTRQLFSAALLRQKTEHIYCIYKQYIGVDMQLSDLKQQGHIWCLNDAPSPQQALAPTGFAELDLLLGGGWPTQQVIELRTAFGIGEFRLLLPYLQQQASLGKLQVYINTPAQLHAPFLSSQGLPLWQLLDVRAQDRDALWAAEQCLKSGCCSTVLLWQHTLNIARLKRLQLAAAEGQAELFLIRPAGQAQLSLPVGLSLALSPAAQGIEVRVLKRRGGWPGARQLVNFSGRWPRLVQQHIQRPVQYGPVPVHDSAAVAI